jgi:2-methylcitrate dehydratase PrpD
MDAPGGVSGETATLVAYMSGVASAVLPEDVLERTKAHVLDTVAAMVSGSRIEPGKRATDFARQAVGGRPEAQVVATDLRVPIISAALANGMLAHADETDDSHPDAGMHPGCSIVPAALAMAERQGSSGRMFLNAVALGYDVGARVILAVDRDRLRARSQLPFSIGGTFGAAAAASVLAELGSERAFRHVLSYAAQQASGIMTYARDTEHVEKAFVFGGMPARNGVTAALMVQAGFTGVDDVFAGDGNVLLALTDAPMPSQLVAELGTRFEVARTNLKKYSVGFPIQAAIEALLDLIHEHRLAVPDVVRARVRLSVGGARTVDDREMPSINLQYLVAVTLLDGRLTFAAAHDADRMRDPTVRSVAKRVELTGDPALPEGAFPAVVQLALADGRIVDRRVDTYHGKASDPLTWDEVRDKATDLMAPVLGDRGCAQVAAAVAALDGADDVGELAKALAAPPVSGS